MDDPPPVFIFFTVLIPLVNSTEYIKNQTFYNIVRHLTPIDKINTICILEL